MKIRAWEVGLITTGRKSTAKHKIIEICYVEQNTNVFHHNCKYINDKAGQRTYNIKTITVVMT